MWRWGPGSGRALTILRAGGSGAGLHPPSRSGPPGGRAPARALGLPPSAHRTAGPWACVRSAGRETTAADRRRLRRSGRRLGSGKGALGHRKLRSAAGGQGSEAPDPGRGRGSGRPGIPSPGGGGAGARPERSGRAPGPDPRGRGARGPRGQVRPRTATRKWSPLPSSPLSIGSGRGITATTTASSSSSASSHLSVTSKQSSAAPSALRAMVRPGPPRPGSAGPARGPGAQPPPPPRRPPGLRRPRPGLPATWNVGTPGGEGSIRGPSPPPLPFMEPHCRRPAGRPARARPPARRGQSRAAPPRARGPVRIPGPAGPREGLAGARSPGARGGSGGPERGPCGSRRVPRSRRPRPLRWRLSVERPPDASRWHEEHWPPLGDARGGVAGAVAWEEWRRNGFPICQLLVTVGTLSVFPDT